jgi:signal peptidase II
VSEEAPPPGASPDDVARRPSSVRAVTTVTGLVAAAWFALDQVTKALAVATLEAQRTVVDLGIFDLRLHRNPNGAFSIPGLFPGLFVVVTVAVVVLVVRALPRTDRLSLAVAYGLVTGGALGNVTDRILRTPGFPDGAVVDFIDFRWWPIFNVADMGIVVGALLIAGLMTVVDREQREAALAESPPAGPDAEHAGADRDHAARD